MIWTETNGLENTLINQTHQQNQNLVLLNKTNFSKPSQASSRKHK